LLWLLRFKSEWVLCGFAREKTRFSVPLRWNLDDLIDSFYDRSRFLVISALSNTPVFLFHTIHLFLFIYTLVYHIFFWCLALGVADRICRFVFPGFHSYIFQKFLTADTLELNCAVLLIPLSKAKYLLPFASIRFSISFRSHLRLAT